MALKTKVLVTGINNLSDARYCAGMGVDIMGFIFDPNDPSQLSIESIKEIAGWIAGVALLAEFKNCEADFIHSTVESLKPDYIAVHTPSLLAFAKDEQIPCILKVDISAFSSPDELEHLLNNNHQYVSYFNLVASASVSESYWNKMIEYMKMYPIILGCMITAENINDLITSTQLEGISLQGGDEIKPGYKEFDDLAEILENIEINDID